MFGLPVQRSIFEHFLTSFHERNFDRQHCCSNVSIYKHTIPTPKQSQIIRIMKSEPFKPSAADQAAVRAALDCCCKVDTSVITFFGKKSDKVSNNKYNGSSSTVAPVTLSAESARLLVSTARQSPRLSPMAVPTEPNAPVFEENETFC
jgi:hypothetical protein